MRAQETSGESLPPMLRKCWMRLNALFQKRVATVGLTPDQYIVLRWLHDLPDGSVHQTTLKRLMFTDPNNIAGLMGRMEKRGLVHRRKDSADGRRNLVFTTEKGKSSFLLAKKIADSLEEEVIGSFSKEEKDDFLELLAKINQFLHSEND